MTKGTDTCTCRACGKIFEVRSGYFPTTPDIDFDAVRAKYPRVAAYIIAREWTLTANDKKAELGKIAQNKIIHSDSNEEAMEAIEEMRHAFSAYCEAQESDVWAIEDCRMLCKAEGLLEVFEAADGESFERVVFEAANQLGVEIIGD